MTSQDIRVDGKNEASPKSGKHSSEQSRLRSTRSAFSYIERICRSLIGMRSFEQWVHLHGICVETEGRLD